MKNFMFDMMFKFKFKIIVVSFVIFLVVLFFQYQKGIDIINIIGGSFLYCVSLDVLSNGSYLFLKKISEKSHDFDYYARFIFLMIMYLSSIYFIIM